MILENVNTFKHPNATYHGYRNTFIILIRDNDRERPLRRDKNENIVARETTFDDCTKDLYKFKQI